MEDLVSDHDAAISLINEEYHKLQAKDVSHPLLRYICDVTAEGFRYTRDDDIRQEFVRTYASEENTPAAVMLTNYYLDLRRAVGQPPLSNPKTPSKPKVDLNDGSINFDDIPF